MLVTLPRYQAKLVFLDPPYDQEREYAAAFKALSETPPPVVVAQHSVRFALAKTYGPLHEVRQARQGENVLSFFEPALDFTV